jgi:uncharacterized protein (TIGR03083 family)
MTTVLDRDHIWAAIDAHRLRVVDLLGELSDEEWRQPSLCQGWTVRDVAAHLTMQQVGWAPALSTMLKYRGNVDRGIRESARERATALSTGQIIEQIRGMIGSRRHNAGVTPRETLIDILVHGQDIAVALDRDLETPPAAAAAAVSRMWTMRFPPPFPATRTLKGFRVVATDTDWSGGEGPEVRGPITALMLVSGGRLAALPQLSGPGIAELAARLPVS